ncbi:MAG TPA: pyruvate formate lyase family protein [Acidobacteriota bacterium]|nr:pyruvate formate lyase family protein [Acidobacteriota bacterium]
MHEFMPVSDRVTRLKERYRNNPFTLDAERALIVTESYRKHRHLPAAIKKAKSLYDVCEKMTVRVEDDELIVGNIGKYYKGTTMWPENDGMVWLYDELESGVFDARQFQDEPMNFPQEERGLLYSIREFWRDNCFTTIMDAAMPEGSMDLIDAGVLMVFPAGNGQMPTGHLVPNYRKVIEKGFGAVRQEAHEKLDALRGRMYGDDAEKYYFYRSVVIVCDAFILLAKRYAAECRNKAAGCDDTGRKSELLLMADSLDHIADRPARTFHEAVQATFLYQTYLYIDGNFQGLSFGRFDQYTYPCLKAELDAGTISLERAQEIVDCFWLKVGALFGARVVLVARVTGAYSTFQHLTLGGIDREGKDATNPVTFMALESPARLQLHEPPVSLRASKTTPDKLFACAFESSRRAGGIPCFQNETLIIEALVEGGHYTLEDARDFCIIGCQEIGGSGNDYPATGGVHSLADVNFANVLLLAVNNGVNPLTRKKCAPETGHLFEMVAFDDVLNAVKIQMNYFVEWLLTLNNCSEYVTMKERPIPALSAMLEGCMESGRDCVCGGAKYNSFGVPGTGTATLAESLIAIKYFCYDAGLCTTRKMYDAVMANWEGYEDLRARILAMPHHYGNNDPYADEVMRWAMNTFADAVCKGYSVRGRFRPGLFTASSHVFAGARAWATPDGRFSGESLSDCISPKQGADVNGPTAVLASACCFDHKPFTNGLALNMKFAPVTFAADDSMTKMRNLLHTYFDIGGMEVQYNIVSSDTLKKAQNDPESYRNLVVRVAGFSAYFVELHRSLQNDIIARTENRL